MRIGIFTNNYLPNPYGVTSSIESFRKEFERLGHQVFIFAPAWNKYTDANKNVFRYPSLDIEVKFRYPLPIPHSKKIDKIIASLDLDIIHSQHPNLLGTAAMRWTKKKNIPLVFTWHTLYDQYTNFVPFLPKKMVADWIIRKAVRYANKCDQIIVPSPSVKNIIRDWGVKNQNIEAVPSGVERDFENPDAEVVRKKYSIKKDETLLFTAVRLTAEKNVEFLFDSVAKVLEKNKKIKFLVAGGGYLKEKLKERMDEIGLNDGVIFAGIVPKSEIKNYFAAGDIFVYASKSETQGMIINEAMYMGLPIVAVNATGICDLVENNVNGFLVSENSPSEIPQSGIPPRRDISRGKDEFADAINKLIGDKELRDKFGRVSAKIAREKYTDKICAQKMLDIYERVIREKNIK